MSPFELALVIIVVLALAAVVANNFFHAKYEKLVAPVAPTVDPLLLKIHDLLSGLDKSVAVNHAIVTGQIAAIPVTNSPPVLSPPTAAAPAPADPLAAYPDYVKAEGAARVEWDRPDRGILARLLGLPVQAAGIFAAFSLDVPTRAALGCAARVVDNVQYADLANSRGTNPVTKPDSSGVLVRYQAQLLAQYAGSPVLAAQAAPPAAA